MPAVHKSCPQELAASRLSSGFGCSKVGAQAQKWCKTLRGPSWASESPGPHLRCGRVLSEWPRGGPLATRGPGPARATVPPLSLRLCTCGRSWPWRRQCSAVPDGPHRTGHLEYRAARSFLRAAAVPLLAGWSAGSSASCKGPAPEIRGGWTRWWASASLIAQSCGPQLNECTAVRHFQALALARSVLSRELRRKGPVRCESRRGLATSET